MTRRSLRYVLCLLLAISALTACDSQPNGAAGSGSAPKGEITWRTFHQSRIFPGTVRDYWVYVPQQYDPARPACVYVGQDGIQFNAPDVFDDLIHRKEMPVVIGIFVSPGRVPTLPPRVANDRENRGYEYDSLGSDYVRFLLEELLPEVEKQKTADGRPIRLSKSGNDACIAGFSSGGICAFTAAWERPDAFSRVFSACGSFVAFRGGQNYASLVRKYEPKPIRVFLQDGEGDLNFFPGDWWMANNAMERSLTFAGYEVKHAWGAGMHGQGQANEIFPQVMRWLWKDWPAPVKSGAGSESLQEILIPGEKWTLVGQGYKFTEGPTANAKGEVFFNDIPNSKTYKIGLDGKITVFNANTKQANGMAFGPDGRLYAVVGDTQEVAAYDADGKAKTVATGIQGNDLVVRRDGGIYVTNPRPSNPSLPGNVWYVGPDGKQRIVDPGTGATGLKLPNGVCLSPDQSMLYVAEYRSHWIWSYQIQPDGSLAHRERYFHVAVPDWADDSGVDGIRCDRDGRLYAATRLGVQVFDDKGQLNCIIPTPNGRIANLCFGGPKFDTLFATCGDRVYKRKTKVKGANVYEKPNKPSPPKP